jgi:hypothetical protein
MPYFSATRFITTIVIKIAVLEYGRQFKLAGSDLIVTGLGGDAELEEFALGLEHESEYALGNCAEVMILEFLALWWQRSEECPAGRQQIGP